MSLEYIRDNCTVADRNHLSAQINKSLGLLQTFASVKKDILAHADGAH